MPTSHEVRRSQPPQPHTTDRPPLHRRCSHSLSAVRVCVELSAILPGLVLSSANSINWGRFLPQIVFTFASYTRLVEVRHTPHMTHAAH